MGQRIRTCVLSLGSGSWTGGFVYASVPLLPVWNTIPDQLFTASSSVSFDVSGYIAEGEAPITFTATGLPTGLTISTAGVISGTTGTAETTDTITVTASNGGGSAQTTFDVTVSIWDSIPTQIATEGFAFTFNVSTYATGDSLTYAATGLPTGLSISTSTGVISGTPTATGTETVTVTATYGGGSASTTFTITIRPPLNFYLLDNAADELRFVNFDGTEVASKNVDLPSGAYYGAFARINSNFATVISSDRKYRESI